MDPRTGAKGEIAISIKEAKDGSRLFIGNYHIGEKGAGALGGFQGDVTADGKLVGSATIGGYGQRSTRDNVITGEFDGVGKVDGALTGFLQSMPVEWHFTSDVSSVSIVEKVGMIIKDPTRQIERTWTKVPKVVRYGAGALGLAILGWGLLKEL